MEIARSMLKAKKHHTACVVVYIVLFFLTRRPVKALRNITFRAAKSHRKLQVNHLKNFLNNVYAHMLNKNIVS